MVEIRTRDEQRGSALVPVVETEAEIVQLDEQQIVATLVGQAMPDYIYKFKQGGKEVVGLTIEGINEAANQRGGITVHLEQVTEKDSSWLAVVKAIDTIRGNERYGAFEQSKTHPTGGDDPYAFTKAIHKAQRNAVKQLIPQAVIIQVVNHYMALSGQAPAPRAATRTEAENEHFNQRMCFGIWTTLKPRLGACGVQDEAFWAAVKRRFGVASRAEMGEKEWSTLGAELKAAETNDEGFAALLGWVSPMKVEETSGDDQPDDDNF